MSRTWPGGLIRKTPVTPSSSLSNGVAPGVWTLSEAAYWKKQGLWPTPVALAVEDVFSTYLYTGNGGSQTINNGIQLGDGYSAGATGGSGDFSSSYLSIANNSNLNLNGGAYTIEAWLYPRSAPAFATVFGKQSNYTGNPVGGWSLWLIDGRPSFGVDGAYGNVSSATAVPLNTWTHVAISSNGTTATLYVNGVSVGSTSTALTTGTSFPMVIGGNIVNTTWDSAYYYNGLISNLRVVKGTQVYTGNFTVPSSALTAISGTQLLCLQSPSPFTDSSANAFTLTASSPAPTAQSSGPMPFSFVAGKGGLVWIKSRSGAGTSHVLQDTVRGTNNFLNTNNTNAQANAAANFQFLSNGFSQNNGFTGFNGSGTTYASWTFREAPNFFDVVTYTGNGTTQNIAHSLGVEPGMIIVKSTSYADDWTVYHRSLGASFRLFLNATNAATNTFSAEGWGNNTTTVAPTATQFTIGDFGNLNSNGQTYVAYLFAHDTTSDGIIQCGSFTADANGYANVNLGWEPQWVLYKSTSTTGSWGIADVMRGMPASTTTTGAGNTSARIFANTSDAETAETNYVCNVNSTGFTFHSGGYASSSLIYIAIRRGPMRPPSLGTTVFSPVAQNASSNAVVTTNFPVDLSISAQRSRAAWPYTAFLDRLRGSSTASSAKLASQVNNAESNFTSSNGFGLDNNTAIIDAMWANLFGATLTSISYLNFRRAPSFLDEVCYTGTGGVRTINHNLGVPPEMIIIKRRNSPVDNWYVTNASLPNSFNDGAYLVLNANSAAISSNSDVTGSTATTFSVDTYFNQAGAQYVVYLFASCPGVSKLGSYTGTGALQTISCGFTTGARLVIIKRTDSTGDWYVWNSATGISSGNDPYLLLNSTAAEVTGTNYVDTDTTGFKVTAAAPADLNANGGSYIFWAVA